MMHRKLNGRELELLGILQEECAEVIQIISKIRRFGIDSTYHEGTSNHYLLNLEIADVLAVIKMLSDTTDTVIDREAIDERIPTKIDKVNHFIQFQ